MEGDALTKDRFDGVDNGLFAVVALAKFHGGQVLKRFVEDGITEKEFRDSVTQLRSGYLMGLESPGARMQALGRSTLLKGKPTSHEETLKAIEAVTMEKVMAAARRVLEQEPCIAIVGKGAEKVKI